MLDLEVHLYALSNIVKMSVLIHILNAHVPLKTY